MKLREEGGVVWSSDGAPFNPGPSPAHRRRKVDPSVVLVLGFVSLINSLTSGNK